MRLDRLPLRVLSALVALAVPVGIAAGCGGSSSKSKSSQNKPPAKLAITATGTEEELKFTAPPKATAGPAEITFTNNAKGEADAQLVMVQGKREDAEVSAMLATAMEGKAVASWFKAAGGVGSLKPGENGTVTQELKPGTYYVVGGENVPKGPLAKFTVAMGQGAGKPPTAPGKIVATDYAFSGQNVKAGQPVEFRNEGKEWHHFLAAQLKPGKTVEDAREFLQSEQQDESKAPFTGEENGLESTVMNGGVSQILDVDLKAGKYVFFCFVSDRGGGPPHVAKGMVSEITVTE